MHISEGFLSPQALAAGWTITAAGVAWGLKKMDQEKIVRVAMASSVFFLASLVNIRVGPSSAHLALIGPIGLILGWTAFPAILTALLLQAVLFQFGGILVLGANTTVMAAPAVLVYLVFGQAVRGAGKKNAKIAGAAAFLAGSLAVMASAGIAGMFLFLSDREMALTAKTILAVHLPLSIIEGAAALFMTIFLKRTFPDILSGVERS
ncbi:MAG: cobalt transporter CbiM [Synergistaceae bacterium]|jgi:cobalt/nickel transport system permease protein|nr:cobalt transporter CbiM [Synergistaceae bacterium]